MDTTMIPIDDAALAVFGITAGWLASTAVLVVGWVNTVKVLFANWVTTKWFPAVGGVISIAYSYKTLAPNWEGVLVGSLALFLTQWVMWGGVKTVATKVGARES